MADGRKWWKGKEREMWRGKDMSKRGRREGEKVKKKGVERNRKE
jgi:hypothetical protein